MGRCIGELTTQLSSEKDNKDDFHKVYIPSGRKELLQIDWLNNYIIRSLLIKYKAKSKKVAS